MLAEPWRRQGIGYALGGALARIPWGFLLAHHRFPLMASQMQSTKWARSNPAHQIAKPKLENETQSPDMAAKNADPKKSIIFTIPTPAER